MVLTKMRPVFALATTPLTFSGSCPAGVVQVVRYALLKHEHRSGTVAAVHEERVREEEAHERELHERELHERELHDGAH